MKRSKLFTLVLAIGLAFGLAYTVSATAGNGYESVPAAAFVPKDHSYEYYNDGYRVLNPTGSAPYFVAPVDLPHGATVTKVTFYFYDDSSVGSDYASVWLGRNDHDNSFSQMADVTSNDAGDSSNQDDTINYATIDNSQYSYFLELCLNSSAVWAYGVVVEYSYSASLPLVTRNHQSAL